MDTYTIQALRLLCNQGHARCRHDEMCTGASSHQVWRYARHNMRYDIKALKYERIEGESCTSAIKKY